MTDIKTKKSQKDETTEKVKSRKKLSSNIVPLDMDEIVAPTNNLYESIAIIAQRSKKIAEKTKEEVSVKLSEFASHVDNLEETFENAEQIEISKYYERQPKATIIAIEEFLNGKLRFRCSDEK